MRRLRLDRQGPAGQAYSENTRWSRENVYFVGLNVPGSNNNKINPGDCLSSKSVRTLADCDADIAEYAERNAKNLAWLSESFATAKAHGSPGIMVVIQADPGFDWPESFYEGLHGETASTRLEQQDLTLVSILHDVLFGFAFDPADISTVILCITPHLVVSARLKPLRSVDRLRAAVRAGHPFGSSAAALAWVFTRRFRPSRGG